MPSKDYDWRSNMARRGWPYKEDAPDDPQYIKDRKELFEEGGNGWWWYTPNKIHSVTNRERNRIRRQNG